jgi:hypothetical protein
MGSFGHDTPVVDHDDPLGQLQGGAAMGHQQRGAAAEQPAQGGVDLLFGS